jgi:hypothetical protein
VRVRSSEGEGGLCVEHEAEADVSGRAVGADARACGDAIAVAVGELWQRYEPPFSRRSPARRARSLRSLAARARERTRKAPAHHSQVLPTMLKSA